MLSSQSIPSDTELLRFLKRALRSSPTKVAKSLTNCGDIALPMNARTVWVLASESHSKFHGLARCGNQWLCPVCARREAFRWRNRITAIAEAEWTAHRNTAVMLTLGLPHHRGQRLADVMQALLKSWRKFYNASSSSKRHKWLRDILKRRIIAVEVTHGENGWHPHLHVMAFVNVSQLHLLTPKAERELMTHWSRITQRAVAEFDSDFAQRHPFTIVTGFSRNAKGRLLYGKKAVATYVSGLASEISGLRFKIAKPGHRTLFQILTDAYRSNDSKDIALLCEAATATFKVRRMRMSPGLANGVPKNFMLGRDAIVKKKPLQVIVWFDAEQWSSICCNDRDKPVKDTILKLARLPSAKRLIIKYLLRYDVDIRRNGDHPFTRDVESVYAA